VGRIANGASVVDPALVAELVSARRRDDPLAALSAREREVLTLMAEGLSNAGIGRRIWVTEGTVEKHVRSILTKLSPFPDRPPGYRAWASVPCPAGRCSRMRTAFRRSTARWSCGPS